MEDRKQRRNRGVKASRAKLEQALVRRGIRSQFELAAIIAENESLQAPPKDMVSKVFREKRVTLHTLERVAKALDMTGQELYLEDTDTDTDTDTEINSPISPPENFISSAGGSKRKSKILLLRHFLLFLVLVATVVLVSFYPSFPENGEIKTTSATPISIERLAVISSDLSFMKLYAEHLSTQLAAQYILPSQATVDSLSVKSSWENSNKLSVDFVISISEHEISRNRGAAVHLTNSTSRLTIASFVKSDVNGSERSIKKFNEVISKALKQVQGGTLTFPEVLDDKNLLTLLEVWADIDLGTYEHNLNRAQTKLHAVLTEFPNSAEALATLCTLHIKQSIAKSNLSLIESAEESCIKAQQLDPLNVTLLVSQGDIYRKRGNFDLAENNYREALEIDTDHVDAMLALVENNINRFRKGEQNGHSNSLKLIERAKNSAPDFWKVPFVASRYYYYTGDITQALEYLEKSKALQPTYNNIVNLSSVHFCQGNMKEALDNIIQLQNSLGANPATDNYLGLFYYANEDYANAIVNLKNSVERLQREGTQARYQAIINLADAYRNNGDLQEAKLNYKLALDDTNELLLMGDNVDNLQAHILYIQVNLYNLSNRQPTDQKNELLGVATELLNQVTDPNAKAHLLMSFVLLEEPTPAIAIYEQLKRMCAGYVAMPELKDFESNTGLVERM